MRIHSFFPMISIFTLMISLISCGTLPTISPAETPKTENLEVTARNTQNTPTLDTAVPTPVSESIRLGKVHFLTGQEDIDLITGTERSYSFLKEALEAKGYEVSTSNLQEDLVLPGDVKVIVLTNPPTSMLPEEVSRLRSFSEGGGSLVVLLEPSLENFRGETSALTEFFESFWEIKVGNDFIFEPSAASPLPEISGDFSQHEIADTVGEKALTFHSARSVTPVPGTALSLVELVKTSEQAWAETELDAILVGIAAGVFSSDYIKPDAGMDLLGPVSLAVVGENASGARVAVFGDADFASDSYIAQPGNRDLVVETIGWSMNAVPASEQASSPTETGTTLDQSGEWIAFVATDYTQWDLYLVRPDGSQLTRLEGEMEGASDAVAGGLDLSWSPDGQMLAFRAKYEGDPDIFVGDLRTGSYRRIAGTEAEDRSPTWSPDGRWIFFTSKDQIIRVSPDGKDQQTIVTAVSTVNNVDMPGFAAWPSISPNSRFLVYSVGDLVMRGQVDIFLSDLTLGEEKPSVFIQNENANDFYPTFAPVGSRLAFISAANLDRGYDLYFTDLESQPVKISNHAALLPFSFAWSPDGQKIAYSVQIGERSEIFVVEPGKGQPVQITGGPLSGETLRFSEDGSRMPSWSPDSSRIVFQSNRDGNWAIYVMNADGAGQTKITSTGNLAISPAWRP